MRNHVSVLIIISPQRPTPRISTNEASEASCNVVAETFGASAVVAYGMYHLSPSRLLGRARAVQRIQPRHLSVGEIERGGDVEVLEDALALGGARDHHPIGTTFRNYVISHM